MRPEFIAVRNRGISEDNTKPQHNLDERNTLGRYEITDKGRDAIELEAENQQLRDWNFDAAVAYEAEIRKLRETIAHLNGR